jgi:NAD(P)-dependent dehydrogenase (short-subunit alcohol dehydrogenase family)
MHTPFQLTDRVAVVTGGASGIGQSICQVFARAGAKVYVLDINESLACKTAEEICNEGYRASGVQADVSIQEEMIRVYNQIVQKEGGIDIVVCNAGIAQIGKLEDTTPEDLDRVLEVNVKGVYNSMFAAIGQMKKQQSGVFLIMASVAAMIAIPERFGYSTTKGAVMTMTYSVARDYLNDGIRCNSISPGRVHTPFVDNYIAQHYPGREQEMFEALSKTQPIGRMANPEEIAHLALYLCADESSFITGMNFPIDGGSINLSI